MSSGRDNSSMRILPASWAISMAASRLFLGTEQFPAWFASRQTRARGGAAPLPESPVAEAHSTLPLEADRIRLLKDGVRGGTPHPRVFLGKSAQSIENKRVEFLLSAKKRKRVHSNYILMN